MLHIEETTSLILYWSLKNKVSPKSPSRFCKSLDGDDDKAVCFEGDRQTETILGGGTFLSID